MYIQTVDKEVNRYMHKKSGIDNKEKRVYLL